LACRIPEFFPIQEFVFLSQIALALSLPSDLLTAHVIFFLPRCLWLGAADGGKEANYTTVPIEEREHQLIAKPAGRDNCACDDFGDGFLLLQ